MCTIVNLDGLQTESRNAKSTDIDQVSTLELCHIINREDAKIASTVKKCLPAVAKAIDAVASRIQNGGRLVYVGAGTSGRLGVLDASEIPPTYSASSEQFVSLIAGGDVALRYAQEGAEDDVIAAKKDLEALHLNPDLDSLIGIAASGRTPYVLGCLKYAKNVGCTTIGIACCEPSGMKNEGNVDHMISVITGPEVVTGSTRMKAGTATKLVLNMLSTGVMIKCGKTFGNMMIDVKATNIKLQVRARNIIKTLCGQLAPNSSDEIDAILGTCGGSVKLAVAVILLQIPVLEARERLTKANGVLTIALNNAPKTSFVQNETDFSHEAGKYVLCVDAGGSKCAAVLMSEDGEARRGEAEGCNASDVDTDTISASISLAVQRAVGLFPALSGIPFHSLPFHIVQVGLAGYDRPDAATPVDLALAKLFNRQIGERLTITSDIELLLARIGPQNSLNSAVVLVAGTGSVAMSYVRDGYGFKRTGRSGGWGHLLGDDGSGYSIGREAIRMALDFADKHNIRCINGNPGPSLEPLSRKVLDHFGLGNQNKQIELLNTILSPPENGGHAETSVIKKIAQVARVVLDAALENEEANAIVKTSVQSLLRILSRLVTNQDIDTLNTTLVLSGGLMQNEFYVEAFKQCLQSAGISFGSLQAISDPAFTAAERLLSRLQ